LAVTSAPLLEAVSLGVAYPLGVLLVWLGPQVMADKRSRKHGDEVRLRTAAMALVILGLWWPQHWLAASARSFGEHLICLVLSCSLALVALTLRERFRWHQKFPRSGLAIAIGTVATAAALEVALVGLPDGAVNDRDWTQALLVAMVGLTTLVLRGALMRSVSASRSKGHAAAHARSGLDPLTGLQTRQAFEERLADMMVERGGKRRLALLFIDLDGFKPVNDTYGHSVGDDVLRQVGKRLEKIGRAGDLVARVGGDEFLMLIADVKSEAMAASVAKRIIEVLRQIYVVDQREIGISCSIGVAFHPGADSLAKLVGRADAAMYAAKRAGGSDFSFYTPAMEVDAEHGLELTRDLRKALANKEFELFYQPKIDASTAKITAAEALLRWRHPVRGEIGPDVFIPIAERSGLMAELSNWVIEDACRQGREWRDSGLRMRVAINLSPQQMRRDDLVEQISTSLKKYRIHPSLLTCEITESLAMEDTKATQETFRKLGELGAHLSIDDFGTGYSSLSYLRRLPARELKIDRSFVVDLESSADARAIVKAIVNLAHALGLKVVAEGVENVRQQHILTKLGCDELQGFLFAKPMSARSLLIWAMSDRSAQSTVFTQSLFDETKHIQTVQM
jgi:diguanylate cyclase (GGDEF)-like protein